MRPLAARLLVSVGIIGLATGLTAWPVLGNLIADLQLALAQPMATYIALAVGGVLGVYARYGLTRLIQSLYRQDFPLATLIVNLLGTFLLAFLFILTLERVTISPAVRTGILTGGLGAFTTFSTFIMEALILVGDGQGGKAAFYLALSVGLGITVAFGAVYIARKV